MKNHATKKKLLIYTLSGIILSIFFTFIYISYSVIPDFFRNDDEANKALFQDAKVNIERFFDEKTFQTTKIGYLIDSIDDESVLQQKLSNILNEYRDFEEILVYNENYTYGNLTVNKEQISKNINENNMIFVENINSIFVISNIKVFGQDGVLVNKIKNETINEVININEGLTKLISSKGTVIADTNSNLQVSNQELNEIISKYSFNSPIIKNKDKVAIIDNGLSHGLTLMNIRLNSDFYANSWSLIYKLIGSIASLVVLFIVMFIMLFKKLFKSLDRMSDWIVSIEDGNFDVNFSSTGLLREINKKFNEMAKRIKKNYDQYKIQAEELSEKNWEVEEANKELELSYQKLQQTINQLNEAEEKYYTLVKNLPEIICVVELDGTITFSNDAVFDILGYTKEELVDNSIELIFPPELTKKMIHIMNKKLKRQRKIVMETPIYRKDGKEIIVEIKLTYHYRNGDVDGVQAIVRDVTKNRSLQNEIIHKNKEILTIYNISKSLSSTIEIDNVFNLIVNEICKIFDANYCILRLFDASKKKLIMRAYTGKFFDGVTENEILKYTHYDIETVQDVVRSRKIKQNAEPDPGWLTSNINNTKIESEKVTNIATIPICSKQEVLGIISLGTRGKIEHKSVNILMSVANNAAVAIENATLYENSKKYFLKTIEALIAAVEAKDKYTEGHSRRVAKYSELIAKTLGLPKNIIENLRVAGILHDIGKIGISDNILLKPGRLTNEEYEEIKQHPIISNRILYSVGLSDITMKAISCHHERYDGRGYPFGLSDDALNIESQIIAVADAFDAMTSTRSYREALSLESAIEEIKRNKGTQFGPAVVDAIVKIFEKTPHVLIEISEETELAS